MPVSPRDLFLSPTLDDAEARQYLESRGFRDPVSADAHLRAMADDPAVRQALGAIAAPLIDALSAAPDPDQAAVGLSRYLSARAARLMFLQYLVDDPGALRVLAEILGTSPFLTDILVRNPEYFHWLRAEVERRRPSAFTPEPPAGSSAAADGHADSRAALNALKRLKRRQLLGIAARDLLGLDSLPVVAHRIAALADLIVERALALVVADRLREERRASLPGVFAVIGLGKLGGDELNYSSDIDLVYVYEPSHEDDEGSHEFFHRLARKLTAALADHTEESYLYRVDLRLRPMGRSGGIAHSLPQLRRYYETAAETFERFALIKARPVAGDRGLGERLLELVQPFVYRKYLDHAALEELLQYKIRAERQIETSVRERNVKLGWGGIREVELFAQVLQLTYGARVDGLRQANTLAALDALLAAGLVSREVRDRLVDAYVFLRTVEHRLQIVQENQTHTLGSGRELAVCARRLRFASAEAMLAALEAHRRGVHAIADGLFERQEGSESFEARQLFRLLSETADDAEGRAFLAGRGLADPDAVLEAVRALAQQAATAAARNVLANLLAACLPRLARSARPAPVLVRLDRLAAGLGGPAELGRSLLEHDVLREAVIDVLDSGDFLTERLIRRPELTDSLLQPPVATDELRNAVETALDTIGPLERPARMDHVRRLVRNEEFKIVVGWLADGSLDRLQEHLSLLASGCAARAAEWHAPVPADDPASFWAVVALGKLGGAELSVHSDLDLVFVYDDPTDPQDARLRWQPFVERTQDFLARPTGEGRAYPIDTRLRPEGTKGPLAIPFAAFQRYLAERAEPWERLAWTRARVVAGSRALAERIGRAAVPFVYGPWDQNLPRYMDHVRTRMETELAKEGDTRLDFKTGRGGLADIDFLVQLVQVREGRERQEFRLAGTRRALRDLPSTRYLTAGDLDRLRDAHGRLRTLETFVRMEADASVNAIARTPDALEPLARRMGFAGADELLAWYLDTTTAVRNLYRAVLARLG